MVKRLTRGRIQTAANETIMKLSFAGGASGDGFALLAGLPASLILGRATFVVPFLYATREDADGNIKVVCLQVDPRRAHGFRPNVNAENVPNSSRHGSSPREYIIPA